MKHQAMMEFILVGFLVAKAVAPLSPRAFVLAAPGDAPTSAKAPFPGSRKISLGHRSRRSGKWGSVRP